MPRDLTRTTLTVLVVGALTLSTAEIVRPFLPALVWATTIVVATWPLLLRLQAALWHSRALAVAVATVLILVVAVVPFWLATSIIVDRSGQLMDLAQAATTLELPPAPQWLRGLPLVGEDAAAAWDRLESSGLRQLASELRPYAGRALQWFLAAAGGLGLLVVQFLLTVAIAAILHANGEAAGRFVERLGRRLAGERGQAMVDLAGNAIRAVAVGVMVTSLVETVVGGAGLALVGVPLATVLTAVMFVFCLAQAGPGVVLIPAVVWMYAFRNAGPATALLAVTVVAVTIDNVLRPFLIRKEADLPVLLVLVGVVGGLAAFGLVGVFVGPAVLAVSYTLLNAWTSVEGRTVELEIEIIPIVVLPDMAPLIHLASAGQLDLLQAFGRVVVMDMVANEASDDLSRPWAPEVAAWLAAGTAPGSTTPVEVAETTIGEAYRLARRADPTFRLQNAGELAIADWLIDNLPDLGGPAMVVYEDKKVPRLIQQQHLENFVLVATTRAMLVYLEERGRITSAEDTWTTIISRVATDSPSLQIQVVRPTSID